MVSSVQVFLLWCAIYTFRRSPYADYLAVRSELFDDAIKCDLCSMWWASFLSGLPEVTVSNNTLVNRVIVASGVAFIVSNLLLGMRLASSLEE